MSNLKIRIRKIIASYFPVLYIDIEWWRLFGKKMDWNNPKDLNEKIQWIKRYTDTCLWTELADKYRVRDYVARCGHKDTLVKLYGKWTNAEDINWDSLPNQFVLKTNNGSGDVIICKDKNNFDILSATQTLNKLINQKYGMSTNERHYLGIPPLIIAEELLDNTQQPIVSSSLIDYKIWCFDGVPECIWTCYNRTKKGIDVAAYDLNWICHPEWSCFDDHFRKANVILPRPKSLDKMLEIASDLSNGFPQVRVDLYEVGGKPFFGELTFSSNMGLMSYFSDEYLEYLGSKVTLPQKSKRNY